ncbi:MAG: protein kinase [Candidatus Acidiferrales bacterium]
MTNPNDSNKGFPCSDDPRGPKKHQNTVLLSDVPDASSFVTGPNPASIANPTLSTGTLAALGQRYEILGEAGHGSMGNVYKARDRETGETVALKLLKPEIASDQVMMDRFKNELLFARKITHKNVCRVHEFNRIGGIAYTSMEFVEGESLRSVLNRFGGFPPRKGIDVAQQICSGLKEAHAQGIVHRDLKPENVMIDGQGNVKIMDFGIARSMEAATRLTGSMVGTPAYMAPEQVAGKPVDYRTDIYSLGLMLYEMFTGTQAFHADTPVAVALKQMRESPPPPHEVEPSIPVHIERAILKCLEKEPSRRFQSVAELERAINSPGAPVVPAPNALPPPVYPRHVATILTPQPITFEPESKRPSPFVWLFMGALLILAVLGGLHAKEIQDTADQLPPPEHLALPKPPEFGFGGSVAAAQPASFAPAETKPSGSEKSPARTAAKPAPTTAAPAKNASLTPAPGTVPQDVQQRAQKAFGESSSVAPETGLSYLWVGRFDSEDRAQAVAKKIKDLGLPVIVIPRHNLNGKFFVVFTGPFGASRVSSVMQWLESQGFHNVRAYKNPVDNQRVYP